MTHLERLLTELDRDAAYPHEAGARQIHQTHISIVFVAGDYAYKLKKPVDFGFVDYGSLESRKRFCEREVELNRRLAPDVYLGVSAVVERDGELVFVDSESLEDASNVSEWAVRMRRMDESHTLGSRLASGDLPPDSMSRIGDLIARFHIDSQTGTDISRFANFEAVSTNALDNLSQTTDHVGLTIEGAVHTRLDALFGAELSRRRASIEARAETHVPCDTHGDLRLEHLYLDDDGDLRIVDCIEFNDAFRYADPISDIAFLVMDLLVRGYREESRALLDEYFMVREDPRGRDLMRLYVAYRSAVRAKVHGFKATEEEVAPEDREEAAERARMHWLFALVTLAAPKERPRLLLVGGLPGTGKSTVNRGLRHRGWVDRVVDTDHVRKELAGVTPSDSAEDDFGAGIYTEEWTEKTYDECARRARTELQAGHAVAVEASFWSEQQRRRFIELGLSSGVPPLFVECTLPPSQTKSRLIERSDDISDADEARLREDG